MQLLNTILINDSWKSKNYNDNERKKEILYEQIQFQWELMADSF